MSKTDTQIDDLQKQIDFLSGQTLGSEMVLRYIANAAIKANIMKADEFMPELARMAKGFLDVEEVSKAEKQGATATLQAFFELADELRAAS